MSTTVVLADDHAMVRESLTGCLASTPDIRVVAGVGSADEAIEAAVRCQPDIVLLDIDMPGMVAFDAARRIKALCPAARVVFLSAFLHDRYIGEALAAGAYGYVTKSGAVNQIVQAIHDVAAGSAYFSPDVQARLVVDESGVRLRGQPSTRLALLTQRELEVLCYEARGMSNKEIAASMNLACRTVDHHVARIMEKLDIHGRVSLARFAVGEGLLGP